jgi:hypothetical protein
MAATFTDPVFDADIIQIRSVEEALWTCWLTANWSGELE